MSVYFSHWFRYEDRTREKSWFMMSQPLSIVIGTPLSRWILETVHWGGLQGWRWVFILEGLASAVCGVIALYYLQDRVSEAAGSAMTSEPGSQRNCTEKQPRRKGPGARESLMRSAIGKPHYLIAVLFLVITGNQGIHYFLPSVVENMKALSVRVQTILSRCCHICAAWRVLC